MRAVELAEQVMSSSDVAASGPRYLNVRGQADINADSTSPRDDARSAALSRAADACEHRRAEAAADRQDEFLQAAPVLLPIALEAIAPAVAAEGVSAYEAGTYDALKARSVPHDAPDIHHVRQQHAMKQIVPGYSRATGPAIALPEAEHAAIATLRGIVNTSPRSLLAREIWNLRQYTGTRNTALQQLINMTRSYTRRRLRHDT